MWVLLSLNVSPKSVLTSAQTGKDQYDSSVKEEEKAAYATGSVFQGLRADLEGFVTSLRVNVMIDPSNRTGSARVFIVSVYYLIFVRETNLYRATRPVKPLALEGIWPRGSFRQ